MILDSQLLFSDAQALTATAASTNSVDFGSTLDLGLGQEIWVALNVDVAFTDVGSDSTITVTIENDGDSAFGSPTTVQTLGTFPALSAVGAAIFARIQPGAIVERYARLKYTTANGNLTTGSVTAAIVTGIQKQVIYPKGYVIS